MRNGFDSLRLIQRAGLLGVLASVSFTALLAAQEPPRTLAITGIEPIPLEGPDRPAGSLALYYRVDIAFPQPWQEAEKSFQVHVNGVPAPFAQFGSSYAGGAAGADFWVYLGKPGKKKIEVSMVENGKTVHAAREVTIAPEPAMRLLGHYSGECLLENEALRFFAYLVKNAVVRLNGKEAPADLQPISGFEGLSIVTVPAGLAPGKNLIEYLGVDLEGRHFQHTLVLYYLAGNKVKVGDRFQFTWGHPGSRSGPYFRITADGDSLVLGEKGEDVRILDRDPKGWVSSSVVYSHQITAKKPGSAQLNLFETPRYLLPERLEKSIQITVEP